MNTIGQSLLISPSDQSKETKQSEEATSKIPDDSILLQNSIKCYKTIQEAHDVPEDLLKEKINFEEKCLDPRSPPSGNEKCSISPEWPYEGGGDGLALVGSDDDSESQDVICKIPNTLNELLNDASAIVPFCSFVETDHKAYDMLMFWFACNGLPKTKKEDLIKSAELIWIKYLRNHKVKVSDEILDSIRNVIGKCNISHLLSIFINAQKEIETKMQCIYMKFCESDIYTSWLFKQEENYFQSSPDDLGIISRPLPTLHEDSELVPNPEEILPRLSSKNLIRSAKCRDIELNSICYNNAERFPTDCMKHENPYHTNYTIGPTVSTFDSELHSVSSGAQTDDTYSFTDSSLDGSSKAQMRHQSRRMKKYARLNPEPIGTSSILASIHHPVPRPRRVERTDDVRGFANLLIKKLEVCQQELESKEKTKQSLLKIVQNENTSDQQRKLHAENSLPPNILADKLAEKVQADSIPSQSILDDHVKRVWDSPQSPGSPQATRKNRQLPHMNYLPIHNYYDPKMSCRSFSTSKSLNASHYMKHSLMGAEGRYFGRASSISHHQMQNLGARLMGLDVNSTISSDSGNVADYHDTAERRIPKSRSMPEDIENNGASDSASANRRTACGSRRIARRPPPEMTDSGVSVVSDSNFSPSVPLLQTDRISSWLNQSRNYTSCDGITHSTYQCDKTDCCKTNGTRSVHTVAGSTSPGVQRGCSGRRNQCSTSLSGRNCYSVQRNKSNASSATNYSDVTSRINSTNPSVNSFNSDRRGRFGNSSSQCTQMYNSLDEQLPKSPINRKQTKSGDVCFMNELTVPDSPNSTNQPLPVKPLTQMTSIVYSFQEDAWPFITKVPSSCITLRKFKDHLPKKGSYRYFFKKFCDDIGGVVFEEITEDTDILPLFEGKIVSQIRKDE